MPRLIPILLFLAFLGSGALFATMILTQDQTPMKRVGDKPTYWGDVTSNVDWCERNGEYSFYIMEFWNTLSSLSIAAFGAYGMYTTHPSKGYELRIFLCHFFMFLVGLGSTAFHATLQHHTQLLDELPMLHGTLVFLYVVLQMDPKVNKDPVLFWALTIFGLAITWCMTVMSSPPVFFQVIYITCVIALIVRSSFYYRRCENSKACLTFEFGLGCYITAGWCWATERMYCHAVQDYQLHAIWHILSGLGTYCSVVFWTHLQDEYRNRQTMIKTPPPLYVPYVHRCAEHNE